MPVQLHTDWRPFLVMPAEAACQVIFYDLETK